MTNQTSTIQQLAIGVEVKKVVMVNVCFIRQNQEWLLIDAARPGAEASIQAARERITSGTIATSS
ncbi:MAG: hypothetical protein ACM3PA_00125 [Methanomassiliicoccales archaeon]